MSDFPFSIPRRGDSTKIENGTSSLEIASPNGACVFTPAGDAAKTTTFAADGDVTVGGVFKTSDIITNHSLNHFFITPHTDNEGVAYTGNNNGNSFRKVLLSARDNDTSTDAQIYFVRNNSFKSWGGISSDSRIKENQTEYKIEDSMNIVKSLKVKKYFNTDSQKEEIGLIAQEVEKILPDAVTISDLSEFNKESDFRFLDYDKVLVHSLGAIQLLEERLAALENK